MTSWAVVLLGLVLSEDGDVLRFGGEAAVPGPDASAEAPIEVAPRPGKADAIYRTRGGLWRFYDGAADRVIELPVSGERLVGWSANGASVLTASATGGGGRIVRWKAGTWRQVAEMSTTTRPEDAAISPDGHHVLVAGPTPDGQGRRFTLFGGTVGLSLMKIDRADARPGARVALADQRAAIVRAGQIEILALPRLDAERVVPIDGAVDALAFADDGATLVVLVDERALLRFAVADGRRVGRAELPGGCTRGTLAASGRVAACVLDGPTRVSVHDVESGRRRALVPAPADKSPVFDPDGTRVALAGNRAVPIWDATVDGVLPAASRAGIVKQLDVLASGQVVALEASGVARVWEPQGGTESYRVPNPAAAIGVTAGGAAIVSAGTPLVALDPVDGRELWVVKRSRPVAVDVGPDGRVYWIDRGGALHVRAASGRVGRLAGARGPRPTVGNVPRLAVSPDGRRVLFGGRLLDAAKGKLLDQPPAGTAAWLDDRLVIARPEALATADAAPAITFAGAAAITALVGGHGVLVAGDADGAVHVWRADGVRLTHRTLHRGPVLAIAVDAARGRIYSAGGDGVILGTTLPR